MKITTQKNKEDNRPEEIYRKLSRWILGVGFVVVVIVFIILFS